MVRKPTINSDGTVKAIRQAETPFASTGELAEYFNVTRQAIRDQRDRLATDPRIEIAAVSNNTVFYLTEELLTEGDIVDSGKKLWSEKEIRELIQDETNSGE